VGARVAQLCWEHSVSQSIFYKWEAKFDGMNVSEAKRLKQLEEENAKLKRIVADQALDIVVLKDLPSKTGEDRCSQDSRATCARGARLLAAAGLPDRCE
jgi:putative transposase